MTSPIPPVFDSENSSPNTASAPVSSAQAATENIASQGGVNAPGWERNTLEKLAMAVIVEDLIRMLDKIGEGYRHNRHPDAKTAKPAAQVLRAVATELEL